MEEGVPDSSESFSFTASPAPLAAFSLTDTGGTPGDCVTTSNTNTQCFTNLTNLTTYTITESTVTGWTLGPISCSVATGTANGGGAPPSGATVRTKLKGRGEG